MILKLIKEYTKNHILKVLFFSFFFVYLSFGLYLTFFNHSFLILNINLPGGQELLGIDSYRVYDDYIQVLNPRYDHYRICVHPLFLLLSQPLVSIIEAIVKSPRAAVLIFQSILASSTLCLMYSTLKLLSEKPKLSFLMTLIFGFSFSTMVFSSLPETYMMASFFNMLILYYIVRLINNKPSNLNFKNILSISLLCLASIGIELANIICLFILINYLIIKIYKKDLKNIFLTNLKIFGIIFVLLISLSLLQKAGYNSPAFFLHNKSDIYKENLNQETRFMNFKMHSQNVHFMLRGTYVECFYAIKTTILDNYRIFIFQTHQKFTRFIPAIIFLALPLIFYLRNIKKYKYNSLILVFFSFLAIYSISNLFYANHECFLMSQNYLPYFIVLLTLLMAQHSGRLFEIICGLFLLYIIPVNIHTLLKMEHFLTYNQEKQYAFAVWIIYALICTILIGLIGFIIKKFVRKDILDLPVEQKYFLYTSLYFLYIVIFAIFIAIFHGRA